MEADAEIILNNETSGRSLRKRKKQTSYADRVLKRRTNSIRRTRSRRTRRHRSLDPPKKDKLLNDSHGLRPSTSICSLKSVIYLGCYRKVPQLIILDDNSDSVQNQGDDQGEKQFAEDLSTISSTNDGDNQSMNHVANNSWNATHDSNNLLNLLSEMCVDKTHKRIVTRARGRECKN